MKENQAFMISLLVILNPIMGLTLQIWKPFFSTIPNFTKTDIPAVLKDTRDIPIRQLILTAYKSRKSDQSSMPLWINFAITMPKLTILGVEIIPVYYKCKKKMLKGLLKFTGWPETKAKQQRHLGAMLFQSILGTEMISIWEKIIPHSMKRIQFFLQCEAKAGL